MSWEQNFERVEIEEPRRARARRPANGHGGGQPGPSPITFYRGSAYRQAPKREMVVKGLMGSGELTFTHGPPKSGKSFLMTSCALAVAEGAESWWGHRIKRPGQVLYLVQEGAGGFPQRLEAWEVAEGRPVPDNFIWTPTRLRFVAEGTAASAVEDVQRVAALVAQLEAETGEPVVLIVIDTAARVTTGADENSARDMGQFLEACAILQDLPSRPHVNVVAHDNAAGTKLRGSTAQLGGGDGFIHVERQGDARTWCLETAKDDVETEKRGFALEMVELGIDEDGDPVRSCVVVEAEAPRENGKTGKSRLPQGKNQKLVLKALAAAICDGPDPAPSERDIPPNARGVGREKWARAGLRLLPHESEKTKREAFADALERLVDNGFVRHVRGFFWLPEGADQ